jgi:hypothetical protein
MKRLASGAVLGAVVAAILAVATPASATTWRNANTSNGKMWLGVAGGVTCQYRGPNCWLTRGAGVVIWPDYGNAWPGDQDWFYQFPDWTNYLYTNYVDQYGYWVMASPAGGGTGNGTRLIVWPPGNGSPGAGPDFNQMFAAITAESIGAPFPGCVLFLNFNASNARGATATPDSRWVVAGVSGGSMLKGTPVILWSLFTPAQTGGWHADQFWCKDSRPFLVRERLRRPLHRYHRRTSGHDRSPPHRANEMVRVSPSVLPDCSSSSSPASPSRASVAAERCALSLSVPRTPSRRPAGLETRARGQVCVVAGGLESSAKAVVGTPHSRRGDPGREVELGAVAAAAQAARRS